MNKSTQRRLAVVALAVLAIALAVAGWLNRDYLVVKREDVRFQSGELTLAGTLFRPRAGERLPAVVLIHGSGAADRRSMSEFARALASHGMAALAYDKRGVGESQGDPEEWKRFNFDHLAQDAVAAFNLLSERTDIDPERIGFLGASQGGWVAPLAASREPRAAFLILVSASVTTVGEDRLFERAARLQQEGFAPHEIEEVRTMQIVDDDVTRSGARYDEFCQLWNANKTKRWFSRVYLDSEPTPPNHPWREWYRTVIDFNPVPILERLSIRRSSFSASRETIGWGRWPKVCGTWKLYGMRATIARPSCSTEPTIRCAWSTAASWASCGPVAHRTSARC